jgi:hypothetical protein
MSIITWLEHSDEAVTTKGNKPPVEAKPAYELETVRAESVSSFMRISFQVI